MIDAALKKAETEEYSEEEEEEEEMDTPRETEVGFVQPKLPPPASDEEGGGTQ